MIRTVFLIQVAATFYMVGLIWFVQIVHYPLVRSVGAGAVAGYEAGHTRRTTWAVLPPMAAELITAMILVWRRPLGVEAWMAWTGLALVVLIWLSTFLIQVPQHNALGRGFDAVAHRRLVAANWLRTVAWSLRGVLMLVMINAVMRSP